MQLLENALNAIQILVEKTQSKVLDEKEVYQTPDSIRIREIQSNTYKCFSVIILKQKMKGMNILKVKNRMMNPQHGIKNKLLFLEGKSKRLTYQY